MTFIFMLTRNDNTVADAEVHLETAIACGVRHIGFKDVGMPEGRLRALRDRIKAAGATCYLEVVSEDRDSEVASAEAALRIGVDVLLGGTRAALVAPRVAGSGLKYMPFPGRVEGIPSVLHGPADDIVASAARLAALSGVDGLDLLAWRFRGDVETLIARVAGVTDKPVVVAGSVDSPAQIAALCTAGAWGFTIGTAALDGVFPAGAPGLEAQLGAILAAERAAGFPAYRAPE
ncbi:4-hydroxythreonine-4-phosphate dehydrogenase [Oceanicola sp. 22II-s10i]|uniref:4-hydroxythreonine-4-phosphate dehydrogenase n=1 Tax=Oceanicola sp. 22II-s10i TaxID=1317116 RepID=UPI000B51EBB7|nr:4-hydroxythreonine-4-phosphate dehydrogenase [Oceanicola sp. 22II-s10i]